MGKNRRKRARGEGEAGPGEAQSTAPTTAGAGAREDAGSKAAPAAAAPAPHPSAPVWHSVKPPLLPSTLATIDDMGFRTMTPVQAATIPLFLQNKDVCVEVRTWCARDCGPATTPCPGPSYRRRSPALARHWLLLCRWWSGCSGWRGRWSEAKWERFASHRLGPWLRARLGARVGVSCQSVHVVWLCHRRELARQTFEVLQRFVSGTALSSILLVGGTDVGADITACTTHGCNVVVATPGRLLDVMNRCAADDSCTLTFKVARSSAGPARACVSPPRLRSPRPRPSEVGGARAGRGGHVAGHGLPPGHRGHPVPPAQAGVTASPPSTPAVCV